MIRFSIEYLYMICNVKRKALGVDVINPIVINQKPVSFFVMLNINFDTITEELILNNIKDSIDTYKGVINATVFEGNVKDVSNVDIDINNIQSISFYGN